MLEARTNHECGRIRKSNISEEYNIIVVGGTNTEQSVEIYDIKTSTWQSGPKLPGKIIILIVVAGTYTKQSVEIYDSGPNFQVR